MKTNRSTFIFCITFFVGYYLVACSKSDEQPAPELSAQVVGTYKLTTISRHDSLFNINPSTNGTMSVVRESASSVKLIVDVTNGNSASDIHVNVPNTTVEDAGNNEVNLINSGFNYGKGGNSKLTINISPKDGSAPYQLIGTK
jgi:hypothetical protein